MFKKKTKYKIGETITCIVSDLKFLTLNSDYIVRDTYKQGGIEYVRILHNYNLPISLPISLFESKKELRKLKLENLKNTYERE